MNFSAEKQGYVFHVQDHLICLRFEDCTSAKVPIGSHDITFVYSRHVEVVCLLERGKSVEK